MYELVNQSHKGFAILSLLLSFGWLGLVLSAPRTAAPIRRGAKLAYIGAMASTGLVGLSGLALAGLASGAWLKVWFPWLGLVAVVAHGICGVQSRKALVTGDWIRARIAVTLQVSLLIAAYGLMTVKPF